MFPAIHLYLEYCANPEVAKLSQISACMQTLWNMQSDVLGFPSSDLSTQVSFPNFSLVGRSIQPDSHLQVQLLDALSLIHPASRANLQAIVNCVVRLKLLSTCTTLQLQIHRPPLPLRMHEGHPQVFQPHLVEGAPSHEKPDVSIRSPTCMLLTEKKLVLETG